ALAVAPLRSSLARRPNPMGRGDAALDVPGRSTATGRLYVLAAAVLWSVAGVIAKILNLDAGSVAVLRSLFAGLGPVTVLPPRPWAFRPGMVPLALVFGAMIGLYLGAVKATTAANAIFLQYTAPFWIVPLGMIFLHERPDRRALLGIALAMVGVAAIVG